MSAASLLRWEQGHGRRRSHGRPRVRDDQEQRDRREKRNGDEGVDHTLGRRAAVPDCSAQKGRRAPAVVSTWVRDLAAGDRPIGVQPLGHDRDVADLDVQADFGFEAVWLRTPAAR